MKGRLLKKAAALALCAALVTGGIPMQPVAEMFGDFSASIKAFADSTDNITVYFTDTMNWVDVYAYYWDDGPNWPGAAMTFDSTNDYGSAIYKVEIPAETKGIIFNSNGKNTVDITDGIVNGAMWYTTDAMNYGSYTTGYVAPENPQSGNSSGTPSGNSSGNSSDDDLEF